MGAPGSVKLARFTPGGREFLCMDITVKHDFIFTPAMSLFVECNNASELDTLFDRLSPGGTVLMPVADFGFSARFGWLNDRFGVSWQFNLT
jgi:predicted 3-demethylubiquinone-9 3-methyltransferase (glyoxalase superfamily)